MNKMPVHRRSANVQSSVAPKAGLPTKTKEGSPFAALRTVQVAQQVSLQLLNFARDLQDAGFKRVIEKHDVALMPRHIELATNFTTFGNNHITAFLQRQAEVHLRTYGFDTFNVLRTNVGYDDVSMQVRFETQRGLFVSETVEQIVEFRWKETVTGAYEFAPPPDVVRVIAQHKAKFDYVTVAELKIAVIETLVKKSIPVNDPLACGRIIGSDTRFLLAQWDDDIDVDALLSR